MTTTPGLHPNRSRFPGELARKGFFLAALTGVLAAAILGSVASAVGLSDAANRAWIVGGLLWSLVPVFFAASGALIVSRQRNNTIGWLLTVPALTALVPLLPVPQLEAAPTTVHLGIVLQLWLENIGWMALIFTVFHLLLVFPTGQLISWRWAWLTRLEALMIVSLAGVGLFSRELGPINEEWTVVNPIGVVPSLFFESLAFEVSWAVGLVILTVSSLSAVVLRFRRATGAERQQMKWLAFSVCCFGTVYVVSAAFRPLQGAPFADLLLAVTLLALPVTIMIAVTRHRLYEIDRIISRTVTYALVVSLLGGAVALLATVVSTRFSDPRVVAGTTLAVAAASDPIRRRIQRVVDRYFNRSRFVAERVMDEFAGTLRDRVDLENILDGWVDVVHDTMQPAGTGVWIRP